MWKKSEDSGNDSDMDSPNDSLKDIKDISLNLKLSLDGDEKTNSGRTKLENVVKKLSDVAASSNLESHNANVGGNSKLPILRRRKHIIVIAIDSATQEDLIKIIRNIFEASQLQRQNQSVGFVLSTSLTMSEVHSLLISGGLLSTDFDAFISTGGSDLYYPNSNADDMLSPQELPFALDLDYHSQIEYRWGGEGLRKTLIRWSAMQKDKKGDKEEQVVVMDEDRSSSYCFSFEVTNSEVVSFFLQVLATIFF